MFTLYDNNGRKDDGDMQTVPQCRRRTGRRRYERVTSHSSVTIDIGQEACQAFPSVNAAMVFELGHECQDMDSKVGKRGSFRT